MQSGDSSTAAAPHTTLDQELPESYRQALHNRFSTAQLEALDAGPVRAMFFYGTLMLPSILASVLGEDEVLLAERMVAAELAGHQRYALRYHSFPALLPSDDRVHPVPGLLCFGITPEQRTRLDYYEGGYERTPVLVNVFTSDLGPRSMEADVYIWNESRESLVDPADHEWTMEGYLAL